MATVYKARDKVLNRYVAVKVLKEEFTTDEEFIRRFNVEAQSAACLSHPNIVSVYDVGHEDGIYFIVMELVKGKTLKQIIEEDGTLPWKWSLNVAMQIASALEAAHKNNIIHRDIKPHNIIITEDGVAKVTDFGIAKAVSNSTITAFGTTIGSVHYFSPEHARGGFTDAKSDLYSLGIVMYEMLTGRVPFDADTPVSIALKHMQEKPVDPMKLNPSIPYSINQIIMKAMQKEPATRYQSATEMLKDMSLALKNPDGEFVEERKIDTNSTQRIGTITDEMLEENERKNASQKKESKLKVYFKEHPKMKLVILAVTCIVAFALALFVTKAINDAAAIKNVQVPELTGKTEQEIKDLFKGTKFTYEIVLEEFSSEVEAGKVISQEPPYRANFTIKENTKFSIVVSKGVEEVEVPKVAGMEYEQAERTINEAKLVIEKIEQTSQKVEEGYVIKQEPEEGTKINAGETIKVYVSKGTGIEKVPVPYITDKTEEEATKEIKNAKLKVKVVYQEDTSKTNGTVLKQSPEGGEVVDENTTITLTVNKISELKSGTVNINLKSLLSYKQEKDQDGNVIPAQEVQVRVLVNDDEVYNRKHSEDTERITVPIKGKGTVDVKVKIGTTTYDQTQLNLDDSNPVWTAK